MKFVRDHNVKKTLAIGNIHSDIIDQLTEACGDLPFKFKFYRDWQSKEPYCPARSKIGEFVSHLNPFIVIQLDIDIATSEYTIVAHRNKPKNGIRFDINVWLDHKRWLKFYNRELQGRWDSLEAITRKMIWE